MERSVRACSGSDTAHPSRERERPDDRPLRRRVEQDLKLCEIVEVHVEIPIEVQ